MTFRRNLAYLVDPSLVTEVKIEADPADVHIDWGYGRDYEIARNTERIAKTLEKIEAKIVKRRPRIIECKHPELHPELAS